MKHKQIVKFISILELNLPYLQNAARVYDGKAEHHFHLCMNAVNELRKLFPKEPS